MPSLAPLLLLATAVVSLQDAANGATTTTTASAGPARILVVMPMGVPSHQIVFSALTRALADRGHHITLVTPYEAGNKLLPTKNHRIVTVNDPLGEQGKRQHMTTVMTKGDAVFAALLKMLDIIPKVVRGVLDHPAFRAEVLDKPAGHFDLVITEAFIYQEAFVALGHKFGVPVVALNPLGPTLQMSEFTGNPVSPAWVPSLFLGYSNEMTFKERFINSVVYVMMSLFHNFYHLPTQNAIVREYFPGAPTVEEMLTRNVALSMVNGHFTLNYPTPLAPNLVEVGGMHIADKPKPLPKDLQDFMDGAKEGVVYFSMGSNLRMEFLPHEKLLAIFNSLGAIKERVLLKWDGPTPEKVSPNIKMIKWAPQADVLAHPNLRAFVTHGGLLSTQESVYHGVPLVGIPVFADQSFNMKLATAKGFCAQVDYAELTEEALTKALREILGNPKYKEAAGRLSRLFRAKPDRPVDKAVFWVEHVLAHGGDHLRPSNVHLPLYQLLLLDVLAAVLAAVVVLLLLVKGLFKAVCWACCGSKAPKAAATASKKAKKTN